MNRGPKAFEDTHTIAGIWIRMVFCKIKIRRSLPNYKYGCLVYSSMQHRLVLLYSHVNLLRPEQPTHHMFFWLNSYVYCFRLVLKHP